MIRNLRRRFILLVFLVMFCAGSVASLAAGVVLNGRIGHNLMENQRAIADMMVDLAEHTSYSTAEIIRLTARDSFSIARTDAEPEGGDIQFIRGGLFTQSETLVKIHDDTVRIYVQGNKSVFMFFFLGILLTAGASIILGTAISGFFSERMMHPVNELCGAIEKVAQGDFSIRVRVPHTKGPHRLAVSFNRMVSDLAGLESLRADFINDVSHEFRTPLASIQGFARLLMTPGLSEADRMEYAKIIAGESKRLTSLSTDILSLSKLENQTIITGKDWFGLDEQLRQMVAVLEPAWGAKDLDVDLDLDSLLYYGNEELIRHIWQNLLSNAIKFTPVGGAISIRLIDAEDSVIVRVKDTGIGMNDETVAHIFEKFYQGDASHAQGGAGLGLALVKRIVELCGGDIQVKSGIGEGSVFSVKLPVERKA